MPHQRLGDTPEIDRECGDSRLFLVDLADPALAPDGWDDVAKPPLAQPEDISVYELHVRDFSASDESVPVEEIRLPTPDIDVEHDVITRTGLHCAPRVHEGIGTAEIDRRVRETAASALRAGRAMKNRKSANESSPRCSRACRSWRCRSKMPVS